MDIETFNQLKEQGYIPNPIAFRAFGEFVFYAVTDPAQGMKKAKKFLLESDDIKGFQYLEIMFPIKFPNHDN